MLKDQIIYIYIISFKKEQKNQLELACQISNLVTRSKQPHNKTLNKTTELNSGTN
jgi:hypothetical protein